MARRRASHWEDYDPGWLVEAARQQRPDLPWLAIALAGCNRVLRRQHGDSCLYFVDPSLPNQPGSEWQFVSNIILEYPAGDLSENRDIVLDV